jgi:hypothetical protein
MTVSNSTALILAGRSAASGAAGGGPGSDRTGAAEAWGLLLAGLEQARRGGHVQRLVRTHVVVGMHPRVDGRLRGRKVGERAGLVQQFAAQRLGRVDHAARYLIQVLFRVASLRTGRTRFRVPGSPVTTT